MKISFDPDGKKRKHGFSLIELLVVLSIIGLLVSLLTPAVQSAREAARRTQCVNNLVQIGRAFEMHHGTEQAYPTGGSHWSHRRKMVNGRPASYRNQQWGWAYQILPYLDEETLWEADEATARSNKPIVYSCPSRRPPIVFLETEALNDYAGIGGGGDETNAKDELDVKADPPQFHNGAIIRFRVKPETPFQDFIKHARITDGLSRTMLLAEKFVSSLCYEGGSNGDERSYCVGWGRTNVRFVRGPGKGHYPPTNDFAGFPCERKLFDYLGSAHPQVFNAVFCDGSVHGISYDTDIGVLVALANREDGGSN